MRNPTAKIFKTTDSIQQESNMAGASMECKFLRPLASDLPGFKFQD